MKISVEISKYPLTESYLDRVDDFLERLHQYPNIKVKVNPISTQIFGDSQLIFEILEGEICRSFEAGQSPFVIKVLKGDLSEMEIKGY